MLTDDLPVLRETLNTQISQQTHNEEWNGAAVMTHSATVDQGQLQTRDVRGRSSLGIQPHQ